MRGNLPRAKDLLTARQILTIPAYIDMQPEYAHNIEFESQPKTERERAMASLADRSVMAIKPNESGQAQPLQWRLAAILEGTPDFVGIVDREGGLLFLNAAGRKMVGLGPADALTPRKIFDYHPEWARKIISQQGIPTALRNGFWSGETAALRHDGVEIPVSQVITAHRNNNGQVEYLSTILR